MKVPFEINLSKKEIALKKTGEFRENLLPKMEFSPNRFFAAFIFLTTFAFEVLCGKSAKLPFEFGMKK